MTEQKTSEPSSDYPESAPLMLQRLRAMVDDERRFDRFTMTRDTARLLLEHVEHLTRAATTPTVVQHGSAVLQAAARAFDLFYRTPQKTPAEAINTPTLAKLLNDLTDGIADMRADRDEHRDALDEAKRDAQARADAERLADEVGRVSERLRAALLDHGANPNDLVTPLACAVKLARIASDHRAAQMALQSEIDDVGALLARALERFEVKGRGPFPIDLDTRALAFAAALALTIYRK